MNALQFRPKKQLKDLVCQMPDVRNRVMHPVRQSVLSADDVGQVARAVRGAAQLGARAASLR